MITTQPVSARLPGRKAGTLDVHFEIDGTPHHAGFPLRVDPKRGQFIALDGFLLHIAENRAELVEHLQKIVASKFTLTWERYLEITYQVSVAEGPFRRRRHNLGPADARTGPVVSIALNFEVVEYSCRFEAPAHMPGLLCRKIGDDGRAYGEERRWEVPDDVIPFSQERLEALQRIQVAMATIDEHMCNLFAGSAANICAQLDVITNPQLGLPPAAPGTTARPKKTP